MPMKTSWSTTRQNQSECRVHSN